MPSAGAVCPPQIIPLRRHVPGIVKTSIDTTTLIELVTGKYKKCICNLDLKSHDFVQIVSDRSHTWFFSSVLKGSVNLFWITERNKLNVLSLIILFTQNVCIKVILHQFWVKKCFPWKFNLEYGGTLTKLFMHVSSRNMFPTIRNLQICVHVYHPCHCCGDWLTFSCFVPMIVDHDLVTKR
jgi:hypothetical protein